MKIVAYLRVSTDRQVEGFGLDVQERAIRRWAKAAGHRIVATEVDEGISGTAPPDVRTGLAAALSHVSAGSAGAIVVARLDRLSRDLVLQEQLLAEVRRAGGRLHSTVAGEDQVLEDDPQDPTRALIRQVIGAIAQWERSMIRLRMQSGRARKRDAGGYAGGQPPYGWRAQGGELVPHQGEQRIIRRIVAQRKAGASLREIAAVLNTDPAAARRSGAKWWPDTVRELLIRHGEHPATAHATRKRNAGSSERQGVVR